MGVGLKRVKYPQTFPEPEGLDKESQAHPGAGHNEGINMHHHKIQSQRAPNKQSVLPCTSTATTHRITELLGVEGTRADHLVHY